MQPHPSSVLVPDGRVPGPEIQEAFAIESLALLIGLTVAQKLLENVPEGFDSARQNLRTK